MPSRTIRNSGRIGQIVLVTTISSLLLQAGSLRNSHAQPADIPVLPVLAYGQGGGNPWKPDRIGGQPTCFTMGGGGCFLTARAMIFSYFDPQQPSRFTPGNLNDCYRRNGHRECGVPWQTLGDCQPPGVTFRQPEFRYYLYRNLYHNDGEAPARGVIDSFWRMVESELRAKRPVMTVFYQDIAETDVDTHMVVIKGRRNGYWIINDPLANGGNGGEVAWKTRAEDGRLCMTDRDCRNVFYVVPLDGTPPPGGDWAPTFRLTLPPQPDGTPNRLASVLAVNSLDHATQLSGAVLVGADGVTSPFAMTNPPPGSYDLYLRVPGTLSQRVSISIPLRGGVIDVPDAFAVGDILQDDVVNSLDLSLLISDYGTDAVRSDLNGDGIVNTIDYQYVVDNYGRAGALRGLTTGRPSILDGIAADSAGGDGRAWLAASRTEANIGDDIAIGVYVDPSGSEAVAADLLLTFDPGALDYRDIAPAPGFSSVTATPLIGRDRGRLAISAYGDASDSPVQGAQKIADVTFRVARSIDESTVSLEHSLGSTTDSNLASTTGADLLTHTSGVTLRLRGGDQRPRTALQFLWPPPNKRLLAVPQTLRVAADDPYGEIERIEFTVRHNEGALSLPTDSDGTNGWSAQWSPAEVREAGVWLPERFQFDARAYVRGQKLPTVLRSQMYEFAFPQYSLSSIIVSINPGADIAAVIARHGGTPADAHPLFGADRTYTVLIPHILDWQAIEPLIDEYNRDPDVDFAEVDGLFSTWETAATEALRGGPLIEQGWNLIALPADAASNYIGTLIDSSGGAFDRGYAYDPSAGGDAWLRALTGSDAQWTEATERRLSAAWIHARFPTQLPHSTSQQSTSALTRGWNLWGFRGTDPTAPSQVFQPVAGRYDRIHGLKGSLPAAPWLTFEPSNPDETTLSHLLPGRGYWIHMIENGLIPSVAAQQQNDTTAAPELPMTVLGTLWGTPAGLEPPSVRAMVQGVEIARSEVRLTEGRWTFALDLAGRAALGAAVDVEEGDTVVISAGDTYRERHVAWRSGGLTRLDVSPRSNVQPGAATPSPMLPTTPTAPSTATSLPRVSPSSVYLPSLLAGHRVRSHARWHLVGPPEAPDAPSRINDVAIVSATDAWAVGTNGLLLHWNGASWLPSNSSPTSSDLSSITANSDSDIWMTGNAGELGRQSSAFHWDGRTWREHPLPVPGPVGGIRSITDSEAWALSYGGGVIRWDGREWRPVALPSDRWTYVNSIVPVSPGEAWGLSSYGNVYHFVQGAFESEHSPVREENSNGWLAVFALNPDDVWFGGSGGLFVHWNGTAFSEHECQGCSPRIQGYPVSDIHLTSPGNGWAITSGSIMHWDGVEWRRTEQFTDAVPRSPFVGYNMRMIRMSSETHGWIFATSEVLRYEP